MLLSWDLGTQREHEIAGSYNPTSFHEPLKGKFVQANTVPSVWTIFRAKNFYSRLFTKENAISSSQFNLNWREFNETKVEKASGLSGYNSEHIFHRKES